ncbi:DUF3616 domain-containing protein [Streptacidiphilus cavernicola]|uniref:DUF3616 domain-containing protein n=1 Tax=Streptacidiphilus cavernicola TaxID=3342716 RepID=A0ABV6W1Z7_9ACTN
MRSSAALACTAAAALALGVPLLTGQASASSYGTPSIALSDAYLSGAVGSTGDPTVTVTISQSGADASALTVAASKSSKTSVAGLTDVAVTGTGGTRTVAVTAHAQGYTDLTLKVTGLGGKTATKTLHYAASPAVQFAATTRYLTGAADGSAAVDLGGGYMAVADDESNTIRMYDRANGGAPVKSWDFSSALGLDDSDEIDIEAAARVGNTIYWTGSMGNNKDGKIKAERSTLFTTTVTGSGASTVLSAAGEYSGLRADLVAWDKANGNRYGFAAATASGQIPKEINGFNVEGLEFAPNSTTTAYIGFRAPLVPPANGGKALLVPVTNMDKITSGLPNTKTHATFGTPIELDLGGLNVRDIRKNAQNQYLIVAGSWSGDNTLPFALYRWDGVAADAPVKLIDLPTSNQGGWEGVVDVPDLTASGATAQLIADNGSADLYGDGTEAKDLDQPEWEKSRSTVFTITG